MKRCLQGFAVVCLAWSLGHPGICSAQNLVDPNHKIEVLTFSSGPDAGDKVLVGRPRNSDPNGPWSDAARNSLSSIWFHRLDDDVRAHLNLPKDRGLIVARVAPGSPEHDMGIRENDVLLTLGDASLGSPADLVGALKRLDDKPAPLVLLRNGETVTIPARSRLQHGLRPIETDRHVFMIGVTTSSVGPLLRAQLKLADGQGLAVGHVDEKGPAAEAGLVHGDILLALNGKPLASEQALYTLVQSEGEKPVTLEVIHNGSRRMTTVSPVRRKADAIHINFMSERDLMGRGGSGSARTYTLVREVNVPAEKPNSGQGNLNVTFTALPLAVDPVVVRPIVKSGNDQQARLEQIHQEHHDARLKAITTAGRPKSPDPVAKRLDAMSTQIDTLRKAVDDLAKAIKEKK